MRITKLINHGCRLALALTMMTGWRIVAQETVSSDPTSNAAPPPSAPAPRSAADLEKLSEPIALYPDPLISIILPASAYPLEIVQAARFVRDTNNIPKLDEQPWDENVKSVAKIPQVIAMMDSNLTWTADLGEAFVDQPKELMDAIQALRAKADRAGTLQTTPQQVVTVTNIVVVQTNYTQVVTVTNQIVEIYPANPQVVYVPIYPPTVYYPAPTYVYNPLAPLVTFGVGVAVGAIVANNCNWYHGGVYVGPRGAVAWGGGNSYYRGGNVNIYNNNNYNRNVNVNNNRNVNNNMQKWQPDQNRMRSSGAGGASAGTREARGWGSAGAKPSTGNVAARPSTGNAAARPSTGAVGTRPSTGTAGGNRPSAAPPASRPANTTSTFQSKPAPAASRSSSSSSSGSAFSGANNSGSATRNNSSRGTTSRSSGSRGGGSRGGGGRGGGGGGGRR